LQELDIQVLAISADETFAQTTFALSLKSPFPFLSDHPELQVTLPGRWPDERSS
jgi:peroxiredoxin